MPFARFENFEACTLEQKGLGHSDEDAAKICGAIQERAEKGTLYKAVSDGLEILSKADSQDLVVAGYASWENIDDQGDVITVEAQVKALNRFFNQAPEWQSITVNHREFKLAQPLLKYTAADGTEYFSHVNEKGTYLISKLRNDSLKTTQTYREKARRGEMNGYSITGLPLTFADTNKKTVTDIEYHSVTLTEKGVMKPVNPMSRNVKLISKADMECDTFTCGAACCQFMTQHIDRDDADIKEYMRLHNVETKSDGRGGLWLKFPVPCGALDRENLTCTVWQNRPDICKVYPVAESPFIPREQCSLLRKRQALMKGKNEAETPTLISEKTTDETMMPFDLEEILQRNGFKNANATR